MFSVIVPHCSGWWPDLVSEPTQVKITNKGINICPHGLLLARWREQQNAVKEWNNPLLFYFPLFLVLSSNIGSVFRFISPVIWFNTVLRSVCSLHCLFKRAYELIPKQNNGISTPKSHAARKSWAIVMCVLNMGWTSNSCGAPDPAKRQLGQNICKTGHGIALA